MNALRLANMQIKLMLRKRVQFLFKLFLGILLFIVFGQMGGRITEAFIGWLSYGMFMAAVMHPVSILNTWYKRGLLRLYHIARLQPGTIMVSISLREGLEFALSIVLSSIVSIWSLGVLVSDALLSTLIAIILSFLALISFGNLLAAILIKTELSMTQMVIGITSFVQLFCASGMVPEHVLPGWIAVSAKAMPLYYISRLLRETWAGTSITELFGYVLALIVITISCFMLANVVFRMQTIE